MKSPLNLTFFISAMLTISLLYACGSQQPTQPKDELAKARILEIMDETQAVGLAVAVVKDNRIVYTSAFGKKDVEMDITLANDDVFRIASISKSFLTTALLTLVEEGKLSLNDDVGDILGFRVRNPLYPDVVITIKMLLSHTSSLCDLQGYSRAMDIPDPDKNLDYAKCYRKYEPGTKYEYCNLAFNMLGVVVERVSGVRFDQYVKSRVIDPLGLYASYNVDDFDKSCFATLYSFSQEDTEMMAFPEPAAYASKAKEIESYELGYSATIFSPTGGMKISCVDLARYMLMHMNYGKDPVSGATVISEESARLMQTPVIKINESNSYCLAFRESTNIIDGETLVGHTGSAYGLFSAMFFDPHKKFGFVVITNGCIPNFDDGIMEIQRKAIGSLYDIFIR